MKTASAEIVREYGPFPGIDAVHGLTFDGSLIWFAAGTGIVALDPDSGEIVRTIDVAADAGTAFDGTHIFQIGGTEIRKIDLGTGTVIASIPAPGNGGASGLAWAEGSLWVGQHRDRKIYQVDPDTGAILRTITSDRFVTGVTWVDGQLWHGTWQEDASDIRHIDAENGTVVERIDMPAGTGVSGMESDGAGLLFCGGGGSGKIRAIRRPTASRSR